MCAAVWQSLSFSAAVANLSDLEDHLLATAGLVDELRVPSCGAGATS